MSGILIDTNLLIYSIDQNEPEKQVKALKVLDYLELNQTGRLGVQNLAEFISVTTRKIWPRFTADQALQQATRFAQMGPVYDLTFQIVLEAAKGVRDYALSYYDAQIWATARLNQVPVIFCEDFQNRMVLEGVRFVNPFASGFVIDQWL